MAVLGAMPKVAVVKFAALYYKPGRNETELVPDYYLHETTQWLVFPHELDGLSGAELREHLGPELAGELEAL